MTTILAGGLQSEHDDTWNVYGAPTEADDYDYGTAPHGPLLKKVLATYAALDLPPQSAHGIIRHSNP